MATKRKTIPLDDLDKVLSHPSVNAYLGDDSTQTGIRHKSFAIDGRTFKIEWWTNICYLYADGLTVPFDWVRVSNTWPNRAKLNLQFYRNGDTTPICILPIEVW